MLFTKQFVQNSRIAQDQLKHRDTLRMMSNSAEQAFAPIYAQHGLAVNEGIIPRDVYQEFDNVSIERIRQDDGDAFLNALMPLARAVNIGKLVLETRQTSDAGLAQTSMSGRTGVKMDNVDYSYDGFIIPIHDIGFGREWREMAAQTSEGFDALVDDARETTATLRRHLVDTFLDGHKDANGQILTVAGRSWSGIRNDSRVLAVDLGIAGINFDFTDQTKTYLEIEAAFKAVRDLMYIGQKCNKELTYYVSLEIASNMERNSSESYNSEKILSRLAGLLGVAGIEASSKLSGNEFFAMPNDGSVRPLVGMGVSTIALPRPMYNSRHEFATSTAMGWRVDNDYFGRTCVLYAS